MASYAVDGGGVGPHIDSYDVFLLQARGRRRWRISRQRDVSLIEDAPLRLLKHFRPTHEWTLDAGDMLYLPPGVAHEGTAIGECITLSIGFRTPSWTQLAEPWFDQLSDRLRAVPAFRDSGARPTRTPARVPRALVGETLSALSLARPTRIDAERVLLAHLTEPKPHVTFDPPHRPRPLQTFARHVATGGAVLDARTRLQYSGGLVAINGEIAPLAAAIAGDVRQLANRRELVIVPPADPALTALLYAWYRSGWLHPRAPRR
jgi:50S ribosomal protein L16 3-hydroxylase